MIIYIKNSTIDTMNKISMSLDDFCTMNNLRIDLKERNDKTLPKYYCSIIKDSYSAEIRGDHIWIGITGNGKTKVSAIKDLMVQISEKIIWFGMTKFYQVPKLSKIFNKEVRV